jgi:hypothetical protein
VSRRSTKENTKPTEANSSNERNKILDKLNRVKRNEYKLIKDYQRLMAKQQVEKKKQDEAI